MGRVRLVILDMDGVILRSPSSWQILHENFNVDSMENLRLYLEGRISYREFMELDVRLWTNGLGRPPTRDEVSSALEESMEFNEGAAEAVDLLKSKGVELAIVTSGIDILASKVASILDVENYLANSLRFAPDGTLLGAGEDKVPLLDKDKVVEIYSRTLGYDAASQVAYVGDSIFDVPVFKKVALPIAYSSDPHVCRHAAISGHESLEKLISAVAPHL